jgi:acetylornithine/N-succinyldiaminopimelate aminotransferase
MKFAHRLNPLRSNLFDEMDKAKYSARQRGQKIIDLSIGSSDLAPPPLAVEQIQKELDNTHSFQYTLFEDTLAFRLACRDWYERRFGISVDPHTEILPLIGSQEGTGCLPLACLDPGDLALLTDPCYPSHFSGVYLADGIPYSMLLRAENDFLPVFSDIPSETARAARLMILSYPNNPTTATAPLSFWQEAVDFCQQYNIILAHDFPYVDWIFEGDPAISVLQVDREKTHSIEFFSMSKSFHMGGLRLGYAIGNADIIQALRQIRNVVNFSAYQGFLQGAIAALQDPGHFVQSWQAIYRRRRDLCIAALREMNWPVSTPRATMYLWIPLLSTYPGSSQDFCQDLVNNTGVALAPGSGFGAGGEGYVRLALVADETILTLAMQKIAHFLYAENKVIS